MEIIRQYKPQQERQLDALLKLLALRPVVDGLPVNDSCADEIAPEEPTDCKSGFEQSTSSKTKETEKVTP